MGKSRKRNVSGQMSPGCLALFALPFACVGLGMCGYSFYTIYRWEKIKSWETVQATVLTAKLDVNSDSDGTTYRATATYEYEFDGKKYSSERVALTGGSDNIGSFQQDLASRLKKHAKNGEPVDCYVNPHAPENALLDRTLRWEMLAFFNIFATAFGSVGLGLIAGSRGAMKKLKMSSRLQKLYPEEPWKWRQDWYDGTLAPERIVGRTFGVVAIWWNLAAVPSWCIGTYFVLQGELLALLILILPVVGLILGYYFLRSLLQNRRGDLTFELSQHGVVGGPFSGVLHIPFTSNIPDGIKAKIICQQTIQSGENSREVTMHHQEEIFAKDLADHDNSMAVIPILFAIPYNVPSSDMEETLRPHKWHLDVKSKTPRIDAKFEIPVFKTEESQENFKIDQELLASYHSEKSSEQVAEDNLKALGVKVQEDTSGIQSVEFPMLRNPTVFLFLTLFAGCWWAVVAFLFAQGIWFFFAVFGAFGLLITWLLIDGFFHSSLVRKDGNGLIVKAGYFGIRKTTRVEKQDIQQLNLENTGSVNEHRIYSLTLITEEGKILIAKNLTGKPAASSVKDLVRSMI